MCLIFICLIYSFLNTSGQPKQCHETLQLQNPRLDKFSKNALANI